MGRKQSPWVNCKEPNVLKSTIFFCIFLPVDSLISIKYRDIINNYNSVYTIPKLLVLCIVQRETSSDNHIKFVLLIWIQPQHHDASTNDSSDSIYRKYTVLKIKTYRTLNTIGAILMMPLTCTLKAYLFKH